jgi:hypothetical protein
MAEALPPAQRGVEIAASLDAETILLAGQTLFDTYWHSGLIREARAVARDMDARCPVDYGVGVERFGLSTWNWYEGRKGILQYLEGNPAAALEAFDKSIAFARDRNQEEVASWLFNWFGPFLSDVTGENEHSLTRARQAMEHASRCGSPPHLRGGVLVRRVGRTSAWLCR